MSWLYSKKLITFLLSVSLIAYLCYLAYFYPDFYIKNVYNIYIIIIILSLIFYFKSYINSSIKYIYKILKNKLIKYDDSFITISEIHYSENGRYLKYVVYNNKLLDNLDVLYHIFNTLINNETFINFGYNKIIFITAIIEESIFSFHHNVLINNDTSFEIYYNKVKDIIKNHYESEGDSPSNLDNIPCFEIKIWNMDNLMNKNIKITSDARIILNKPPHNKTHLFIQKISYHKSNYIKPLKKVNIKTPQNLATLDIETIENKGFKIPCLISLTTPIDSKIFLINLNLLEINPEIVINNLWKEFFNYLETNNINFKTIYIHNLGRFDGIFLFKALSNFYKPNQLETIIDDKNKFIIISLKLNKHKIVFKDSFRIFPVSLDQLCKVFNVKGKTSTYNKNFNKINILKKKIFIKSFFKL
uniref:Probable DNA polymerase n=1 Tax=Clavaria fumosa TaxID=264083 RepID=A0A7T3PCU3_9AGAR|nr:DNA polymerase [Clavaria fumosa]QPZ51166.1 DNA polymerase [Clavaria fumosa]